MIKFDMNLNNVLTILYLGNSLSKTFERLATKSEERKKRQETC